MASRSRFREVEFLRKGHKVSDLMHFHYLSSSAIVDSEAAYSHVLGISLLSRGPVTASSTFWLITIKDAMATLAGSGWLFFAAAKKIMEYLAEAERTTAGEHAEPRSDLIVTAPIMFGRLHVLSPVLASLNAFLKVSVELMLSDRAAHFLNG